MSTIPENRSRPCGAGASITPVDSVSSATPEDHHPVSSAGVAPTETDSTARRSHAVPIDTISEGGQR
jgi:hypothetical protein